MRARLEELQEALAYGEQRVSPDPAIRRARRIARFSLLSVISYTTARDAVAALETIRLNLLRYMPHGNGPESDDGSGLAREIAGGFGRHVRDCARLRSALVAHALQPLHA